MGIAATRGFSAGRYGCKEAEGIVEIVNRRRQRSDEFGRREDVKFRIEVEEFVGTFSFIDFVNAYVDNVALPSPEKFDVFPGDTIHRRRNYGAFPDGNVQRNR